MAVIAPRPRRRAGMLCLLLLLAGGCSLVQAPETEGDRAAQADRLARGARHADAAATYASLAQAESAQRDYYHLRAAQEFAAAGNVAAARAQLAAAAPDVRARLPVLRAFAGAEISLAQGDGAAAVRELDQIQVPPQLEEAQHYWQLRGRGAFLAARPAEGTRAYIERERFLAGPDMLRANREELYARLRTAAEKGTPMKVPPKADGILAGWLELAPVALELARNPMGAQSALAAWRRRFPVHPANDSVLPAAQAQLAQATEFPDQIALLLPLSGRSEPFGVAVRDGFIAAYLEQGTGEQGSGEPGAGKHPRLRIYDAAENPTAAYEKAVADGASFVVGPLTKEDVAAVVPLAAGRTPTLALNFLADGTTASANFYQFALLPEDEARAAARRMVADGRLRGVALAPMNEIGSRVLAAFTDELTHLGGALLDTGRYDSAQADFSDLIHKVLQVKDVKGEPSTHRTDAGFVFVVGAPVAARLIRPQLKFHYAGDVPMYCISDSFEPDPKANTDMDGVIIADMPWMISSDPVTSQVRNDVRAAWPARASRRGRLYAFGFDAYRLIPALKGHSIDTANGISGMTGKLRLDDRNRIRRELDWAEIKSGVPHAL
ncbi:MAG: penicillin-binding protein activator [Steroidobacteraceae bacterium]